MSKKVQVYCQNKIVLCKEKMRYDKQNMKQDLSYIISMQNNHAAYHHE